jgi:hypothetical protein
MKSTFVAEIPHQSLAINSEEPDFSSSSYFFVLKFRL